MTLKSLKLDLLLYVEILLKHAAEDSLTFLSNINVQIQGQQMYKSQYKIQVV